jgi:lipoprotein-releasing system ATP-binding protein
MAVGEIQVRGLHKQFEKGGDDLHVLRGIDLTLSPGERVAIRGQSGSGKSTFLHVLGTLDHPSQGQVSYGGRDVFALPAKEIDAMRNQEVGFVFQFHHLLPDQTALRNVMLPALIGGLSMAAASAAATELLTRVGLGDRMRHQPGELSGGEQQRVAIARALIRKPSLLLADEPTGNLDPRISMEVIDLLIELNAEIGSTLVIVTHSVVIAERFDRQLSLVDGRFAEQGVAA